MAAGGFKTFVAGETLDQDEINDYLMQGVLVFADSTARDAAITSPVEGQFAFLKSDDKVYFYDSSAWVEYSGAPPLFNFLVVGGGGAGGSRLSRSGSGGGAGGYRNSVTGELSGGSVTAESALYLPAGSFTVTVGAGGAGGAPPTRGSESRFAQIISYGGGKGNGLDAAGGVVSSGDGGSGAGEGGDAGGIGQRLLGQGSNGGTDIFDAASGGGGGAGVVGGNATGVVSSSGTGGNGGAGLASSITGSSVTRGGGGGGGARNTGGTGGTGGGGNGAAGASAGTSATVNTGGGGGGSGYSTATAGGNGGSGIVVIKYPDSITLTIGGGLTSSTATAGGFKTTTFTAGTDTVSF